MLGHFLKEIASFFDETFRKEETWWILFITGFLGAILIPFLSLPQIIAAIIYFLEQTWWLWLFLILFYLFRETWLHWKQEVFKEDINWVLLELKIPRLIEKSSKAMEQVLSALHALGNAPDNFSEKYMKGEIPRWFSFEMVGFGGEIHFYVRVFAGLRNLVEPALFSYYPDLDIIEVPDYIDRFPGKVWEMYERGLDLWGTEMKLDKDEIYPIKTYTDFENEADEKNFDPLSSFMEVLGKLKKDELLGIQILSAPASSESWSEKYEPELKKLREPETRKVKGRILPEGGNEEYEAAMIRSPGQTDVLKAVEENLSKPAFNTLIRFIYVSSVANYSDSFARKGIASAFNQFTALNSNSIKANKPTATMARVWNPPRIFPKTRTEFKKARLLRDYMKRDVPPEVPIGKVINSHILNWNVVSERFNLSTKSLATLFHVPTVIVLTEPHLKHLESKRAGPPAGLAIFGEEEELEKYK
ncbi:MAG: hypothetical protein ABSE68_02675 [Minisyncoccia bacterium]